MLDSIKAFLAEAFASSSHSFNGKLYIIYGTLGDNSFIQMGGLQAFV